jgi:hypothetical protein
VWRASARIGGALVLVLGAALLGGCRTCPINWVLLPEKRAFNALKNRTTLPSEAHIDPRVSLETLLERADDRTRWSADRAATIEGYIVRVIDAGAESANCFSLRHVDAHVEVAMRPDAPPNERVVAEVTPPMREWARRQGLDWSTAALQRELTGRRVRLTGWLLFDTEHDEESENTRPGRPRNWRATAWEIHPITHIEVVGR